MKRPTPIPLPTIRASQPDSKFRRGRRELLKAPGYDKFRLTVIKRFEHAKREVLSSPECVKYAAVMMSNVEASSDVSHDAGNILLYAVKNGVDVKPVLTILAGILLTDELPSVRSTAAQIIAEGASMGTDISSTYVALGAALEDPSESVRDQAHRALQAAGQIS